MNLFLGYLFFFILYIPIQSSIMSKDSSPSISEEHIVPSSSSHSSIKTTSTTSAAVSGWIDSAPWSGVSLDQLSTYARRASNSSLNLLNVTSVLPSIKSEDAEQRLIERIQKGNSGSLKALQLSLNNSSQGLSQIYEHINRRVPQLVDQRQQLHALSERVATANADLVDASEVVTSMERIESFVHMADMIQASLKLVSSQK
ncbi:hypothetical protein BCR42DRAFT_428770 [Absidia repens]|uniref:BLOC-1-related complex subunit 7 n=1 Tax=Absidia repens TaxID=90262 RepID=A0A1X2HXX8_9FUNG|nr:hypothetical protein BCR42DRAFT_428770 [Absidia repens]